MDWQALWIWGGTEQSPRNEWRCFRKQFAVPATTSESASLRITADSRYVLFVNGVQVGRGPVRSWPKEQFYDTYEIGHLLKRGEQNQIAALVMHFGVSTFYYLRGRGGLLAQLDYDSGEVGLVTDDSWLTSIHQGYHTRSPRMSCQQSFAEFVDGSLWAADWMEPAYDDTGWQRAEAIGAVGMAPWTTLQPRDIPMLTEETVYPVRVESLAKVNSFKLSTVIDIRNVMAPGSEDHADIVQFVGYVAVSIRASAAGRAMLGFLSWGECLAACSLNGQVYQMDEFYGIQPERYLDVELQAGDNLLLIDITTERVHHGKLQLGVYADDSMQLSFASPLGETPEDASDFWAIGPFDWTVKYDFKPSNEVNWTNEAYLEVFDIVAGAEDLRKVRAAVQPIPLKYVAEADVLGMSMWRKDNVKLAVPAQLQNAIIPNAEAGIVPVFEGFDTEVLIDLGKEYSGYLHFDIEAAAGTVLDWYGFEYRMGDYRQETYGLDNTVRYVTRAGRQTYTSPVRRGLRYLALTIRGAAKPVRIYGVSFIQSNYPIAEVGRFTCSDALLNDIWEISKHTTKLCMEDTFVDCPAYEQTFWVGDSRNEALVSNYLFGSPEIIKRCLRLVPGSKDQSPLYSDQVPSGWSSVIPNWTFFWAIACQEYYEQTNDRAFAAEMYGHIAFTLEHYLDKIDSSGLFNIRGWNLLDWAPIDQPDDGIVTHQNLFLVRTLRVGAEMGELAGDSAGAVRFREAADRLEKAINAQLWDEEQQAYIDCIHPDGRRSSVRSMQTQVIASLTGVAKGERKRKIESYLFSPPPSYVQIGSPFMSFFYYEALAAVGGTQRIIDDIRHNFGNMVDHDATTCWEQYPNFAENRANPDQLTRSHCHAWSAAPAYFLGREILGIRSLSPGWQEVEIAPQLCGLAWARGSVPHPAGGKIEVSWKADEGNRKIQLRVTAPEGVKLQIKLPEGFTGDIEESVLAIAE